MAWRYALRDDNDTLLVAQLSRGLVVGTRSLVGDVAPEKARRIVENRMGEGALARLVVQLAGQAGIGSILFLADTLAEAATLEAMGIKPFDDIRELSKGDGRPNGSFEVSCMGEYHRIELRGITMHAVDHDLTELMLLERIGVRCTCAELEGRRADFTAYSIPVHARKAAMEASGFLLPASPTVDGRLGGWIVSIARRSPFDARVEEVLPVARVYDSDALQGAVEALRVAKIVWSPVVCVAAAVTAYEGMKRGAAGVMALLKENFALPWPQSNTKTSRP